MHQEVCQRAQWDRFRAVISLDKLLWTALLSILCALEPNEDDVCNAEVSQGGDFRSQEAFTKFLKASARITRILTERSAKIESAIGESRAKR
jgi:hypothetical protein